ncbi:hypothetical protein BTR23_16400 [Alkalihalophilus pseudofirmus]|nr:hypothetical protein BTR23_16400 [Alkalihalophilus pseudofirmus]
MTIKTRIKRLENRFAILKEIDEHDEMDAFVSQWLIRNDQEYVEKIKTSYRQYMKIQNCEDCTIEGKELFSRLEKDILDIHSNYKKKFVSSEV